MDNIEYVKCAGVYIFTNKINKKVYVGESLNIQRRMKRYKNPEPVRAFERALIKYGSDGFHVEIEYLPNFKKNDLLDLEELLIKNFKSLVVQHGYNIASRGNNTSGHKLSEETKLKMSISRLGDKNPNYGKPLSEEAKEKLSKAFSGSKNPNYGKPLTSEHKARLSFLRKGVKLSDEVRENIRKGKLGKKRGPYKKRVIKTPVE